MKKVILILIILVVVVFIVYRAKVVLERTRLEETKLEKSITPVEVEVVKKGNLTLSLNLIGDIKGKEEIDIFPKASGKLLELKVKEGDRVKKDQVVAVVDRDVDGVKFEPVEVISPVEGIVGMVYLDQGAAVNPPEPAPSMGTPLIRVVNMDQVKAVVNVVEEELGKIKKGQEAKIKVDAYPDKTFSGNVTLISPLVNQLTRTASVEIALPNPQHLLKPGMFAQVEISLGKKDDLILIPAYSILQEGEGKRVFVVTDGKAIPRKIETGISQNGRVEIKSGLAENDSLITSGQFLVKADEPVKVIAPRGGEK
ncbi:MAG: efflux RND transporter periplasmic adaptor subunit [candidate division Zixibacteria bacterium]|nr:efflux RND transporter periplasmic adaptor subunit [candidate division Zixibacteria bacterium]